MRFPILLSLLTAAACATAQPLLVEGDVCLDVEVVAIHNDGPLAGMTTYRLYATLPGPQDVITTVFGDVEHPTSIQTTTSWYQDVNGGQFPCANNPLLFTLYPDLEWDSWLTIGIDGPPVSSAGEDCPQVVMSTGSPFATEFENGQSFTIDDLIGSAWFCVPTNTNGLPDADGRVLLAQLTTDGDIEGVLYVQVLPGGVGLLAEVVELPIYGPCDEIQSDECPEEIFTVEYGGCDWGFESSGFQPGESAVWTFGDDVVEGGHFAQYSFGSDGEYPVGVTFTSDLCPQGVTLETTVVVEGCSEVECPLEVGVEWSDAGEGNWVLTAYGMPDEAVVVWYGPGGDVIGEGDVLDYLGTGPVCAVYETPECPEGVEVCVEIGDPVIDCGVELFVTELATCGAYLVQYEGEPGPGDVTWYMNGNVVQTGGSAYDFFLDEGIGVDICVVAVGADCPDGEDACVEVFNAGCVGCPGEGDGFIEWWVAGPDGLCQVNLELGLTVEADIQAVEWTFGDELGFTGSTFVEHVYAETGVYEVCATVLSVGCPEGVTYCTTVEVGGCEVECTPASITFTPSDGIVGEFGWFLQGEDWAQDGYFWISPEGTAVVQDFCLPDGCYTMEFWALSGSDAANGVAVDLSGPDGPFDFYEAPSPNGMGGQVFTFGVGESACDPDPEAGCNLSIEAVLEADGSWTLTAVTDATEDLDFVWTLSDGSILNGVEVNHTFATGSEVETACVSAVFWECGEVLNACVDLEGAEPGSCEEVVVALDGETLAELLAGLEMQWALLGAGFDLEGTMALDPEVGDLGALVLCLPQGCYAMSLDMQGVPGLEGLPGLSLDLEVDGDIVATVDLDIVEDLITLEFGVLTECGDAVMETAAPIRGLSLYPNPAESRVTVSWPGPLPGEGLTWQLRDAAGRQLDGGRTLSRSWEVDLGAWPAGAYLLEVVGGTTRQVGRVMVAR